TKLASEVVERMRPELEAADCAITLDAPGPVTGEWDAARLEQVIVNLLANAAKYGRGKPIDVRVLQNDSRAELVVRDRGIGISPDDQKRIFGRFERAVSEQHYGGFGLGLWISLQVIEGLGGRIDVDSALGHGATFTVVLPLRPGLRKTISA
ncbi:MAG: sensor histidine kinase, partial [Planctomycetota bacterium]